MFQTHVVDLHICKITESKSLLKCLARMIRMNMYLHYVIKGYNIQEAEGGYIVTVEVWAK